jgi:hypothetical protein
MSTPKVTARIKRAKANAQAAPATAAALAQEMSNDAPDWERVARLAKDLEAYFCQIRRTDAQQREQA